MSSLVQQLEKYLDSCPSHESEEDMIFGFLAGQKLNQIVGYDCGLGRAAQQIFMIISGYSDQHGICWPSVTRIAENLGISRAAVAAQIRNLEERKYLKRTPRFNPETGRQTSNVFELNLELAQKLRACPDVFSKKNVGLIIVWLTVLLRLKVLQPPEVTLPATSGGCRGVQLLEFTGGVNRGSCTKKTNSKKHIQEEQRKGYKRRLLNNAKVRAASWEQEKRREKETGITSQHMKRLKKFASKLREFKNPAQMTDFDLRVNKVARSMKPKAAIEYQIMCYGAELACVQKGVSGFDEYQGLNRNERYAGGYYAQS